MAKERPAIGWREWVALPDLGVERIKVKVDTGARTSALHAFDVRVDETADPPRVRFKVHPIQRSTGETVTCEAPLVERRWVRSSNGKRERRPVIVTALGLLGERWPIEVTLTSRDMMGFRMLLGRQAIRRRVVVNPGRSFLASSERRKKRGTPKRQRRTE
jgi:hypothetical protein